MRIAGRALAATVAAALAYLALWPIDAEPTAWAPPPSAGWTGPYAAAQPLGPPQWLPAGGDGPEDVALAADGTPYTGLDDGRIVRLRPGAAPETFAHTGGRPLGLRFESGGALLVADGSRGLLRAEGDGRVSVLAAGHGGVPFGLADDLDVAADGTVYFTDATTRGGLARSIAAIVEHRPSGRLLAFDPATAATRVLLDGLCFANGVALAPDAAFVLVVETACYRVRRLWLQGPKAGTSEVVLEGLPGFPDGISGDGAGTYWLALVSPRNRLLDALHPRPALKKALLRLPAAVRPGPARYGAVLGIDGDGRVLHSLHDPRGHVALVTNAVPHGGWLYLGSLHGGAVARVPRPATGGGGR